jgi:hypothetical protein
VSSLPYPFGRRHRFIERGERSPHSSRSPAFAVTIQRGAQAAGTARGPFFQVLVRATSAAEAAQGTITQRAHLSSIRDAGHSEKPRWGLVQALGKLTMFSWFSPWQAARLSLEAQRILTFNFLRFVSGQERQRQEVLSDGGQAPRLVDQSVVASMAPARPTSSMATGRRKTLPVRKAMGVSRKPISPSKVKDKSSRRKAKSRRK